MNFKYKWKPNTSQKREFSERMKIPEEKQAYEERKHAKTTYSDDTRSFKHKSFVPTQSQWEQAGKFLSGKLLSEEQKVACDMVYGGYIRQEKIQHDYIHIVNELTRSYE